MEGEKPLRQMAEAFNHLATAIRNAENGGEPVKLSHFCQACSSITVFFRFLGVPFTFVAVEYVAKVNALTAAATSRPTLTLATMMDGDKEANRVRDEGSHTRILLRVKRGLHFVKILLENMIASNEDSLKVPASQAYEEALAPFHGQAMRRAAKYLMVSLPTKPNLFRDLNEDDASAKIEMRSFIAPAASVVQHVDGLYMQRDLGIDW